MNLFTNIDRKDVDARNIKDKTCDGNCSRCGDCCGMFIPFTDDELDVIKKYVKKHNIKPYDRVNKLTKQFNAHCCFYDENKKECRIYPVRPFVCKDFMCNRKNWREYRDKYELKGKYNSSLSKTTILATFDDLIYEDVYPILAYILDMIPKTNGGIEGCILVDILRKVNRLDLLKYFDAYDDRGKKISGIDLLNNNE